MRPRGRRSLLAAAVLGASAAALLVVAPASEVAAQSTTVQFASDSVNVREGTSAQLALTLSSAAAADVTVEVTATSGTATGGDFAADPVSVTIASGAARAAFEVPVPYDGAFEGLETFAVSIDAESLPSGISLGDPAAATVRVFDVNFVPTDWSLKPSGLSAGDQFRLVFMTAAARDATAADIADYDAFVQAAAATGHNDIRDYADGFQVLGSTATVDAAQHTATNVRVNNNNSIYTPWYQIPFYWLNGSKIADDHNDLWDGSWDAQHHRDTRYQNGGGGHNVWPHTGTRTGTDGLAGTASDHPLGNTGHNVSVGVWSTDGDADTDPINGGNYSAGTPRNLLAVSSVFEVRDQTNPEIAVTSLNAPYEGRPATFRVTAFPAPAAPLTVSLTVSEDNSASQDFLDAGDEGTVTVTIAAAASSNAGTAVLKVPTVNDSIDESNGTVTVTVAPGAGYTAGRAASARAAVTDDDHTGYVVEAKKWAVNESGNGTRTELIALIGWYASRTDDQGVDLGLRERVSLRPLAAGQTVKLALTAIGATAGTHFTLALKKGSRVNDGVTLVTTSPHSPQNPALIFSGAGTSVARLILTAVDNNDRADRQIRFVADNIYYNSVGAVGGTRGGGRLSLTSKPIAIIDDENTSPTTVRFGTATTSGYEHRGPLQPVVVLSRAFGKDIPLRIAVADGTATAGDDYLLPPTLTVTIPAGVTSHSIDIPLVSDLIPEPDETLTLTMSPTGLPDGVELGTPSTNTVTIKDNPESQVGFARENYGVTEGTTVQPVLTLSRHFSEATTVRVTAAAGTAAAGDFPPGPFDVTFPPLAQKASFSVPIPYDGAVENPESFTLSVDETTLPIGLTLAAGRSTTVRIADAGVVPNNWPLKPAGLNPGDQFRLVFLSSTTRDAASADIATYDSFVQAAAAAGHTAVRDYASGFAVLGSTSTVGARDHAMTAPSGDGQPSPRTPVYWLGGAKITDDHDELWAGAWDARRATDTRNESGGAGSGEAPHTGTRSGTGTASDHPLGNTPDVTTGAWGLNKNPVSDQHRPGSAARPLLAISPVFRVGTTPSPEVAVTALNAPSEGRPARFKITASPVPAAPLTVSLTVSEDNSASQDYIAGGDQRTLTATIPGAGDPGAGAALLEVPTIDDTVDEPDGAVTVTVNSGAGYVVGRAAAAAAAVIDNENTELTFRAKKRAIYENGSGNSTEAILAIGLGNQEGVDLGIGVPVALRPLKAGQTLTVPLSFEGATAGGSHFTVALKQGPGVNTGVSLVTTRPYSDQHPAVVFSGVGASVATLVLTAVDNAERADRTISTSLPRSIRNRMTGLGGGRIRLRTPRITLSIIDDESTDPITVRFEQTNFDVHEHRGPGQPTIVLSRAHGEDIPLRIAVAD
ncbi:MAG: hypothetical protein OXG52_01970, partial [bacterium]|nr:hypothetical protein [bacterium]